jgi:hypothetical protein
MPAVRSLARFAGAALMLTSAVVGATATGSFASGESTAAVLKSPLAGTSNVFTWDYAFHQNGGHALSNVAIAFCSADILGDVLSATPSGAAFPGGVTGGHDGFGAGVKFGVTAPTGTVTVTFAHPHPIVAGALQIQSHSGDGDTGDAITTAAGPGPCPAEWAPTTTSSTTSTTVQGDDSEDPPTTTPSTLIAVDPKPEGHGTTTTTTTGGVTAVNPTTTTTAPAGTTTTTTAPGPTTTTIPTEVDGIKKTGVDPQTTVLGETVERPAAAAPTGAPGSMARTGIGHFMFLMVLALSLFGAGLVLLVATRRQRQTTTG